MGCFDYINETALVTGGSNSHSVIHQLTIEKCISKCRTQNATYAVLQVSYVVGAYFTLKVYVTYPLTKNGIIRNINYKDASLRCVITFDRKL